MQLRDYQQVAVTKLNNYIQSNLGNKTVDRRALLQAPTGAGKTVMMSSVINSNSEPAYVVLSPARGGLVEQTEDSLATYSDGGLVDLLTPDSITRMPYIQAGNTVVLSWESSNKDNNLLIRDNENGNVFDLLRATDDAGIEIVVIVDEAHFAKSDHSKAQQFLDRIAAEIFFVPLTIEITATPSPKNIPDTDSLVDGTCAYVKVPQKDVIAAGMITKQVVVNDGVVTDDDTNFDEVILQLGLDKIREISAVAPYLAAMLIQIPVGQAGDKYLEVVLHWLERQGLTEDNGKVAIYLSNDKTNTSNLKDSDVEVIIFKQGLVMGWDLPRAKVLVTFRESKNFTFKQQVLGRIMRMPEHKHYDNDLLDNCYVYTTIDKSQWSGLNVDFDPGYILDGELTYRGPEITLPASKNTRVYDVQPDVKVVKRSMQSNAHMKKLAPAFAERVNDPSLSYYVVANETFDAEEGLSSNTEDAKVKASDIVIEEQFKKVLDKLTGDLNMSTFRAAFVAWAHSVARDYSGDDLALDSFTLFLSDEDVRLSFSKFIDDFLTEMDATYIVESYEWSPPARMPFSSAKSELGGGALYAYVDDEGWPTYRESMSKPESMFAQSVDQFGFDSWFKNGTGTEDFGIALPDGNHFPDVIAVKDGSPIIIEIKDEDGAMSVASRTKAKAWGEYTQEHSIPAAVVYYDPTLSMWMAATSDDPADDIPLVQLLSASVLV